MGRSDLFNLSTNEGAPEMTSTGPTKARSRLLIICIVLAIVFFVTTCVFLALFIYTHVTYADRAPPQDAVCSTTDCVVTGAAIASKMNMSADPCMDFNEYACGRFNRETILPEDTPIVTIFESVSNDNFNTMQNILTEMIKEEEPRYLSNMKRYYKSCMDIDTIEEVGYKPYLNHITTRNFPTLNGTWDGRSFNLSLAIAEYMQMNVQPLLVIEINRDWRNSSRNVIYLLQPTFTLPMEYLGRWRNDVVIMGYQKYLADIAVEIGANQKVADNDAGDVVNLMIALSKIMVPKEETRDYNKLYNPMNMTQLSSLYPELDIHGALNAVFRPVGKELPGDHIIINQLPTYIGNISLVLKAFSNRTIQNLFAFTLVVPKVGGLTRRMREISLEFEKVFTGRMAYGPQWKNCVAATCDTFSLGMGKQFVERTFSEKSKAYMEDMVVNLKNAFKQMIEEITWMGQATKDEAFKKLAAMKQHIGYPDEEFEHSDIETKYENYSMSEFNFYENRELKNKLSTIETLLSLWEEKATSGATGFRRSTVPSFRVQKLHGRSLGLPVYEVNAGYDASTNEMHFPAGILRFPLFSLSFPAYLNYGAIGVVIGHEITHGFDDQGSQFDDVGILKNWWQKSDLDSFRQRTQCIVNQSLGFFDTEVQLRVNAIHTQGETVADNGGLEESFRAYKEVARQQGESPALPGLGLTSDQHFFLSYSQLWCSKMTTETRTLMMTTDEHPLGIYRILGPLQNSPDFAKAFNCPIGSYMNPEKMCDVW